MGCGISRDEAFLGIKERTAKKRIQVLITTWIRFFVNYLRMLLFLISRNRMLLITNPVTPASTIQLHILIPSFVQR